jgi:hypothetical protein
MTCFLSTSAFLVAFLFVRFNFVQNTTICETICDNGECKNRSCVCLEGYVTFKNLNCSYKLKDMQTALYLSVFLGGFGIDWFYLARGNLKYIIFGLIKCLVNVFCVLLFIKIVWLSFYEKKNIKFLVISRIILVAVEPFNILWWLNDFIKIAIGNFKDGNNIELRN